jgi:hypothetical protein
MEIQLLMVAIQTRIVLSQEELEKLALEELMIRPNNLGALRRLELTMGTLTQLIEHSKFEAPGSHEDRIGNLLCKAQLKAEGSRFDGATQIAITTGLIDLLKVRGLNESTLTVKSVINQMYTAYVLLNKQPVGKLTKDANEASERVLLAQTGTKDETKSGRGRWKKRPTMEEYEALVSKLAKAKSQLSQQKIFIERLKTSKANAAADQTSGTSGDKRKFEVEKARAKAKKAATKPQKSPTLKPGSKGWKIMSPTGPTSDSGSDQDEDSEDEVKVSRQKAKYARVSSDHQINPHRERAYFARVKMQQVVETPEKDVTHDKPESADGPMTRGRKRLIDIVMDAEDAQDAAPIPATKGNESEDSDEMPELESIPDDENEEVFIPINTLHRADPDRIVEVTDVSIMVYPDNTIRMDKRTDELVKVRQIVNGPIYPSFTILEKWATGDGGASQALNNFEANSIWYNFGRIPQVNIYRMVVMLRRAGIFHCYCDISIQECTEVMDVFRAPEGQDQWPCRAQDVT